MPQDEDRITATEPIPLWIKVVVVLGAVLMGMGAVIAFVRPGILLQPHAEITPGVRTYAGYLTSRNAVLAIMLLVLLMAKSRRALGNLLAIVGLIQLLDCFIDCFDARWAVAPGVLVLGLIFIVGANRLCGPFWRRNAWT